MSNGRPWWVLKCSVWVQAGGCCQLLQPTSITSMLTSSNICVCAHLQPQWLTCFVQCMCACAMVATAS